MEPVKVKLQVGVGYLNKVLEMSCNQLSNCARARPDQ